jgi:hypothetical protein
MNWKVYVKKKIPSSFLNSVLLKFPYLYKTKLVYFETNLLAENGIGDLLNQLSLTSGVQGVVVECGSSRCGASVIMANYLKKHRIDKKILACDSFEGFDRYELKKEKNMGLTTAPENSFTTTSYDYVTKKLKVLHVDDIVTPIKGYFTETLPNFVKGPVSFCLIDCDLRDSLMFCGEYIWKILSPSGRLIFDDYTSKDFKGAKLGVDDFIKKYENEIQEHGLLNRLYYIVKK